MVNVRNNQPHGLYLAEFPVQWLGGDQLPEDGDGGVDALGQVLHVGDHLGLLSWSVFSGKKIKIIETCVGKEI